MRKRFFFLVLLSIILIALDYFNITKRISDPAEPLITGVKSVIYQRVHHLKYFPTVLFGYENIVAGLSDKQKLANENRQIKIQLQNLEEENNSLRKQLGAPLPPSFRYIPADVIAVSRYMEINAGNNTGVKKGMAVVDGQTLIGKVIKTTESRSQVQLLSDSDLTVPTITNRGSRGNTVGQLGEYILFKDVLQKDPLFLEDILLTTGEGGFPKELLIGTVSKIDSDDAAVYKHAQIKSYSNNSLLKKVFVIEES